METIERFLDGYENAGGRSLRPQDRALLSDALSEFLLDEQWLRPGHAGEELLRHVSSLCCSGTEGKVQPLLRKIETAASALAARLERSERAAMIMREHLTMLAEQKRMQAQTEGTRGDP